MPSHASPSQALQPRTPLSGCAPIHSGHVPTPLRPPPAPQDVLLSCAREGNAARLKMVIKTGDLLAAPGFDVHCVPERQATLCIALQAAAKAGHAECVAALVDAGANCDVRDNVRCAPVLQLRTSQVWFVAICHFC